MQNQKLDFHRTFRLLASFRPSILSDEQALDGFIADLLSNIAEPTMVDELSSKKEWKEWLGKYKVRIESEREAWNDVGGDFETKRVEEAQRANPRFVLRQWVLEEVIKKLENDAESGKRVLGKVLHVCVSLLFTCLLYLILLPQMACNPFEPWGHEGEKSEEGLSAEEKEERRLCGVGAKSMLGFQCSCSS